jgi:NAD(P)-dependent dehydrogenase (short-subunit alcohol dehydrogenase family)
MSGNKQQQEHGSAALVIGAGGGIGGALLDRLLERGDIERIYAVSRRAAGQGRSSSALRWLCCDHSEGGIGEVTAAISREGRHLSHVVICTGLLHDGALQPEKSLQRLQGSHMETVLRVNTVLPALWLGALVPLLRRSPRVVVAALSARVGSIGDNRLGGWYSYRASKAALNMVLQCTAIELARVAPAAKLIAFHPGTTDTGLSRPFQARVAPEKLFSPSFVADRLLELMDRAQPDGKLDFLDWDGKPIPW